MKMIPLSVVRFCAIECKMQMSGEVSVWDMVNAMIYADEQSKEFENPYTGDTTRKLPTVADVLEVGRLCEPYDNANGFRTCAVQIGFEQLWDCQEIPRRVVALMESLRETEITPDEFFLAYERIHPFRDGNGRSGQVLFNWLNGTMSDPVWASNHFNDPRRVIGYGA